MPSFQIQKKLPFPQKRWHWQLYGIPLLALVLSLTAIQLRLVPAQAAADTRGNPHKLVQLSQDSYTNTGNTYGGTTYHKTGYEPASSSFGSTIVSTFQVGRFSNGGSTNLGWATSTDAGKSWHTGLLSNTTVYAGGLHAGISNASVAYDPKDHVWLIAYLFVDGKDFAYGSATAVSRSLDGGLTWSAPRVVAAAPAEDYGYDKPWISCDSSARSPFYGHCYLLWNDNPQIDLSTSTDGGMTWGAVKHSVSPFNGMGGELVVQPNGTVVVVTPENIDPPALVAFTSTDGGQSWAAPVTIASLGSFFPSLAEDASGTLYAVWGGGGDNGVSTMLSSSTDGTHWTVPRIISTSYYDHVALAADSQTAGTHAHLGLTYYNFTTSGMMQPFFISSTDGGQHWSSAQALSTSMSVDWLVPNKRTVGDYISTVFSHGRAFPFFVIATARGSNDPYHQEIYTVQKGIRV